MDSARDTLSGGLPHSEIPGSTIARISPGLFAACHVLHRLSVPRHPPDALNSRLSATPNGKDHPCSKARQTLLSEDTLCGRHTRDPSGQAFGPAHGFPLRSHNSLLHHVPSTIAPRHPLKDKPEANSASCRVPRDRAPDTGLSTIRFAFRRLLRKRLP